MITLGIRTNAGEYSIEAERQFSHTQGGKLRRAVMDVYIMDGRNRIIIDWKPHEITSEDFQQLDHYIWYVERVEGVSVSRIVGIAG